MHTITAALYTECQAGHRLDHSLPINVMGFRLGSSTGEARKGCALQTAGALAYEKNSASV